MYKLFVLISFLLVNAYSFSSTNSEENYIFEFHKRSGLPNVSRKIFSGDTTYVAYLGGSITEQKGWRVLSMDYLKERFPKTPFVEIDASMGGTSSLLGVLRMDRDVLKYNPDIVFVEFAVNDAETSEYKVIQSIEGIVRKIWRANQYCDICFVYTTTEELINKTGTDILHNTVVTMEKIADFYNIPSVYLPFEVISLLKQGKLVMSPQKSQMLRVSGNELNKTPNPPLDDDEVVYFSPDGVHPFVNTGHVLYMSVLEKALNNMLYEGYRDLAHSIKYCLSESNYENSRRILVSTMRPSSAWKEILKTSSLYKKYNLRFDELWCGHVGATLNFTFKGSGLVSYDIISPEGCRLEITVDGKKFYVNRFDGYCTYSRYHFKELISGLDSNVEHYVQIKVIDEGLDKKNLLFERNRKDFYDNPMKYKKVCWLLNSIFVIP